MTILSSQVLSPTTDLASYLGDGDCNHDSDCEGSLICGNNNCNKEVIWVKLSLAGVFHDHFHYIDWKGGLWDLEDDCCARKCSLDTCDHGEGTCTSNDECNKNDFHSCGEANCHSKHFEPEILKNNMFSFSGSDNCCMRWSKK